MCLDYCNSVLYNLPKSSILSLQRIQNQAARILTRTPRRDHITEVVIDLHWLKIKERIVYKILILTLRLLLIAQKKKKRPCKLIWHPLKMRP